MSQHVPKRAVYTALIGSYESLQEQPVAKTTDVPFICLTDDPHLTSETWDVRLIEPAFAQDSPRSSRYLKITGGPTVAEYDETLWIDNRIVLLEDPDAILDEVLAEADLAVIHHSYRDTVIAEFDEVARAGLDEPARIYEQLIHYAETKPHVLDQRPYWGAIIARRWTPEIQAAMETWLHHVLRYSRRDQLSMRYALDGVPRVLALDLDNFGSHWHTWIIDQAVIERDHSKRTNAFRTAIRAPLASVASLKVEVDVLRAELAVEKERTATEVDRVTHLRARVARLVGRTERLQTRVDRLQVRVGRLLARVERQKGKAAAERARSAALAEQLAQRPIDRMARVARRALGRRRRP
jgi:ubiquinone biosynthesis protein UbiJ